MTEDVSVVRRCSVDQEDQQLSVAACIYGTLMRYGGIPSQIGARPFLTDHEANTLATVLSRVGSWSREQVTEFMSLIARRWYDQGCSSTVTPDQLVAEEMEDALFDCAVGYLQGHRQVLLSADYPLQALPERQLGKFALILDVFLTSS